MSRKISDIGEEMLVFQNKLAKEYNYKPVPINLFVGDVRKKYEAALPEWCKKETNNKCPLYTADRSMLCAGFNRVVIGDYGAFIEITPEQICMDAITCKKGQEFRYYEERYANNVKYLWLTAKDTSDCKIYLQKKTVEYADYIPGMYYISPYEVFLTKDGEF